MTYLGKLLFSPGPVHTKFNMNIDFSHRSKEFQTLVSKTKHLLKVKLKIPGNYRIIFINGSGTAAIETVLSSLMEYFSVYSIGEFGDRICKILDIYEKQYIKVNSLENIEDKLKGYTNLTWVDYETSISKHLPSYTLLDITKKLHLSSIVDMVSSIGFNRFIPADIVIFSSSKILRGIPVMGIIAMREDMEFEYEDKNYYLNLQRCEEYIKKNQTPHTSLIPQIQSLYEALKKFNWEKTAKQIYKNEKYLKNELSWKYKVEGEPPVLTLTSPIKIYNLLKNLKKENIEVYWNTYLKKKFQVSLYSEERFGAYERLVRVLNQMIV